MSKLHNQKKRAEKTQKTIILFKYDGGLPFTSIYLLSKYSFTHPHPIFLQREGLGREEVDVAFRHHSEGVQRLGLVLQEAHVFHLGYNSKSSNKHVEARKQSMSLIPRVLRLRGEALSGLPEFQSDLQDSRCQRIADLST